MATAWMSFPGLGGVATSQQGQNDALGFVETPRPNLVDELRAGVNRGDAAFTCNGVGTLDKYSTPDQFGFGTDFSFRNSLNVPLIQGGHSSSGFGCSALGDSNGQTRRSGTWHLPDNLSQPSDGTISKWVVNSAISTTTDSKAFGSRPAVDFTAFGEFWNSDCELPGRLCERRNAANPGGSFARSARRTVPDPVLHCQGNAHGHGFSKVRPA